MTSLFSRIIFFVTIAQSKQQVCCYMLNRTTDVVSLAGHCTAFVSYISWLHLKTTTNDWLMPSDKCNSITANAMGLIFHCSMLLQPERCLLAYHSTYNAFFMDLPVSSFVSHSSLLTAKSVDLGVAHDGFPS